MYIHRFNIQNNLTVCCIASHDSYCYNEGRKRELLSWYLIRFSDFLSDQSVLWIIDLSIDYLQTQIVRRTVWVTTKLIIFQMSTTIKLSG
jgi:hypothetical protein